MRSNYSCLFIWNGNNNNSGGNKIAEWMHKEDTRRSFKKYFKNVFFLSLCISWRKIGELTGTEHADTTQKWTENSKKKTANYAEHAQQKKTRIFNIWVECVCMGIYKSWVYPRCSCLLIEFVEKSEIIIIQFGKQNTLKGQTIPTNSRTLYKFVYDDKKKEAKQREKVAIESYVKKTKIKRKQQQ